MSRSDYIVKFHRGERREFSVKREALKFARKMADTFRHWDVTVIQQPRDEYGFWSFTLARFWYGDTRVKGYVL